MGGDFSYAAAFNTLDLNALKQDLRKPRARKIKAG
jgi:catalase (peroxidase I)